MKILSLELKGYHRLMLRNIEYVKYTPESLIQLILGSNGSGKSSLLKELSPLPADPKEFSKDGFKSIEIEHHGDKYHLSSILSPTGNKFHFVKNGVDLTASEELNAGHTVTVYRDLCRLEFGITPEIHRFLLGEAKFSSMSPPERRQWFTRLSDVDYTYAIRYYQSLKDQHRDIVGAIKIAKSKLQHETAKKLGEQEEARLRKEIATYKSVLTDAISLKPRITENARQVQSGMDQALEAMQGLLRVYDRLKQEFYYNVKWSSKEDAEKDHVSLREKLASETSVGDYLADQLLALQKQMQEVRELAGKDLRKYQDEQVQLRRHLAMILPNIKLGMSFADPQLALTTFMNSRDSFTKIVELLPANKNKYFSRQGYAKGKEDVASRGLIVQALAKQVEAFTVKIEELEHRATHPDTVCPSCNHTWKAGFSKAVLEDLYEKRTKLIFDQAGAMGSLGEAEQYVESCGAYFKDYLNYKRYTESYPYLEPVWKYVESSGVVMDNPVGIYSVMEKVQTEIEYLLAKEQTLKALEENEKWVKALESQQDNPDDKEKTYQEIEAKYYLIEQTKVAIQAELSKVNSYVAACKTLETVRTGLMGQLEIYEGKSKLVDDSIFAEYINGVIVEINGALSEKEQILSRVDVQAGIVLSLKEQIDDLEGKRKLLAIAVRELSPNEGLIAKGLTGFINHFLLQMNSFVRKIWTYPMEICLVNLEEDSVDLDYKFEVKINDQRTIPDVSKASSAQMEVMDLAFRIVSMAYLKMLDYPLALDEFGAKFDSGHRHLAFHIITSVIAQAGFSQIFMISHNESAYGSLVNCDISILCDANVVIPEGAVTNRQMVLV